MTFLVGTSPSQKFIVHKGAVEPRSEFVRLALRGEWKEASERTIPLPDDDPAAFSVYQQWLYTGMIHTCSDEAPSKVDPEYKLLVKAYVLGEKIIDPTFKDCVVDAIIEKLHDPRHFDTGLADLVFGGTPPTSLLRRLWIEIYFSFGNADWITPESMGETGSMEFLVEFSRYQIQHRSASSPFGGNRMFMSCTYHEHGAQPCHRQMLPRIG